MSSSSIRADTSRNSSSTDSLPSHPLLVSFPQGVPSDTDHLTVSVKAQTTKKGKYMKHVISVQQEDGGKSAGTNLYGYDFGDFSKERYQLYHHYAQDFILNVQINYPITGILFNLFHNNYLLFITVTSLRRVW